MKTVSQAAILFAVHIAVLFCVFSISFIGGLSTVSYSRVVWSIVEFAPGVAAYSFAIGVVARVIRTKSSYVLMISVPSMLAGLFAAITYGFLFQSAALSTTASSVVMAVVGIVIAVVGGAVVWILMSCLAAMLRAARRVGRRLLNRVDRDGNFRFSIRTMHVVRVMKSARSSKYLMSGAISILALLAVVLFVARYKPPQIRLIVPNTFQGPVVLLDNQPSGIALRHDVAFHAEEINIPPEGIVLIRDDLTWMDLTFMTRLQDGSLKHIEQESEACRDDDVRSSQEFARDGHVACSQPIAFGNGCPEYSAWVICQIGSCSERSRHYMESIVPQICRSFKRNR